MIYKLVFTVCCLLLAANVSTGVVSHSYQVSMFFYLSYMPICQTWSNLVWVESMYLRFNHCI